MAIWALNINVPDGQQTRILNALKAHYANNGVPNPSNAQVQEYLRLEVVQRVKNIVLEVERRAAADAVVGPTPS